MRTSEFDVHLRSAPSSPAHDPPHGVLVDQLAPASFAWSEWSTGRVTLVDQMDRAGQRIVVVAPCVSEAPARALTAVENRIARRAGQAMTNRVIAAEMKLSQTAVENHLSRALRKLGLRDRVALARLYTQLEADGRV